MSNLPEFDAIKDIIDGVGHYRLDRLGNTAAEQIAFLTEVIRKFGSQSTVRIVKAHEGYPSYIAVKPEAEIDEEKKRRETQKTARREGLAKLTKEERDALYLDDR